MVNHTYIVQKTDNGKSTQSNLNLHLYYKNVRGWIQKVKNYIGR